MTAPTAAQEVTVTVELKHLTLTRALSVIDLETTGTDTRTDRIVEVAVLTVYPDGSVVPFVRRVNPGRAIPAGASAIHGITDADVAGAPAFAAIAPDLFAALVGSVPARRITLSKMCGIALVETVRAC